MKSLNYIRYLSGIFCAVTFGMFLVWGSLTSSDFPRGIMNPPPQWSGQSYQDMDDLGVNLVWTNAGTYSNLSALLEELRAHDMQAIMKRNGNEGYGYLLQFYSNSQYMRYEADMEYTQDEAIRLWEENGTGYYHFKNSQGEDDPSMPPEQGKESWHLDTSQHSSGYRIEGPSFTGNQSWLRQEWMPGMPDANDTSSAYRHRICAAADVDGLPDDSLVFRLLVEYKYQFKDSTGQVHIMTFDSDSIEITAGDFSQSSQFELFSIPAEPGVGDTVIKKYDVDTTDTDTSFVTIYYQVYWPANCDLWVDWIESMDMKRGYNYFWTDALHQEKLDSIYDEAYDIQDACDTTLYGFWQSETTRRMTFTAHRDINDTMRLGGLKPGMAVINWSPTGHRRFDHFITVARPQIFSFFQFPFSLDNVLGDQTELDTLAHRFKKAREACSDTLEWNFMAQAHRNTQPDENNRNPERSEILVQAYMALAHGARGMSYYCYCTNGSWGLVDPNYAHTDTPFVHKWQAVHDIFAQLDSIGDILLSLERKAAFCVADTSCYWSEGSITNVEFTDDDTNYIEVGQFDSSGTEFLILVNRRTNADRHITVETDLTGISVLTDVYTQEQFISENRKFTRIPFAAGQGRVFRLVPLSD